MLHILAISSPSPYNLYAYTKEENKGLLLSIAEISMHILEENLIQTYAVVISELVTISPCAKQHCTS